MRARLVVGEGGMLLRRLPAPTQQASSWRPVPCKQEFPLHSPPTSLHFCGNITGKRRRTAPYQLAAGQEPAQDERLLAGLISAGLSGSVAIAGAKLAGLDLWYMFKCVTAFLFRMSLPRSTCLHFSARSWLYSGD